MRCGGWGAVVSGSHLGSGWDEEERHVRQSTRVGKPGVVGGVW